MKELAIFEWREHLVQMLLGHLCTPKRNKIQGQGGLKISQHLQDGALPVYK